MCQLDFISFLGLCIVSKQETYHWQVASILLMSMCLTSKCVYHSVPYRVVVPYRRACWVGVCVKKLWRCLLSSSVSADFSPVRRTSTWKQCLKGARWFSEGNVQKGDGSLQIKATLSSRWGYPLTPWKWILIIPKGQMRRFPICIDTQPSCLLAGREEPTKGTESVFKGGGGLQDSKLFVFGFSHIIMQ